jgi:hypothetical protein
MSDEDALVGMTVDEAITIVAARGLQVRVLTEGGYHHADRIEDRVTLFVDEGVVVRAARF